MMTPTELWVLSCGHLRALDSLAGKGGNQPDDSARCYDCPARSYPSGQRIAPMRKLTRKAAN